MTMSRFSRRVLNNSKDIDNERSQFIISSSKISANSLPSVEEILEMNPSKHGYVQKKNNSLLAWMLPCFFPEYNKRYLILIGSYILRYESIDTDKLKGIPIPLDAILSINKVNDDTFEISTIRKKYLMRAVNIDDCNSWIESIKQRKYEAIKENLGHVNLNNDISSLNKKLNRLFHNKISYEHNDANQNNGINPINFPT